MSTSILHLLAGQRNAAASIAFSTEGKLALCLFGDSAHIQIGEVFHVESIFGHGVLRCGELTKHLSVIGGC